MVSRFIIISAAISLLSMVTFAQHQANPLVDDNGGSTQLLTEEKMATFRAVAKRNTLASLTNGLLPFDHEKKANDPQTNTPGASDPSKQTTKRKKNKSDEHAGDVLEGDDQPDPAKSAGDKQQAKRSAPAPLTNMPIAPGSATNSVVSRRAAKPDKDVDGDEDLPDEDQTKRAEEEDKGSSKDAKRELRAHIQRINKRDIDRFIMKSQFLTDAIIAKTSNFADKVGGGSDDSGPKSDLPNGRDDKNAAKAISHAQSISSSAKHGDVKAMSETH
ncbi:hypothetical protein BCR42DRAFT_425862 [Absidia repens]|uniref:Uncharacterized protein n=1 Tax=Absidia repens TaxID=90262 RepID=A0A1X2I239_9FUNG|nr:hypothetical protein BCR42DRAFT_425862 [Absidia repens]